jgi:quercetin dioxygenase-like cupin family protein
MSGTRWKLLCGLAEAGLLTPGLALAATPATPITAENQAVSEVLLQTTKSWDGETYTSYPAGQPQVSVVRIYVPPHSALPWHSHPVINAGYVLSGKLFVEKKCNGMKQQVSAGEVLPEMLDGVHRGYTESESALLIVFYAGAEGVPLTVLE